METAKQLRLRFIHKASRVIHNEGRKEMLKDIARRFKEYGIHPRCQVCFKKGNCRCVNAGTLGDEFDCRDFMGHFGGGIDKGDEIMVYKET